MTIKFTKEIEKELIHSIKRFFVKKMDDEIGDLKAMLLLDFCLQEIGPIIYNRAVSDAKAFMQDRIEDVEGSCYEPEHEYWKKD
ncbi:MAG: DUF2164 domain-containing protein [Planctomycetes bacterium]|nr:DUF2164 domain-containing protein [Planctomycetota bacterium]